MPVTLSWREFFRGRNARVARMWARLSLETESLAFDLYAGTQPYTQVPLSLKKGLDYDPEVKVLRNETRQSEYSKLQDNAERLYSALRDWRPIPAASSTPFRRTCSGEEDLPYHKNLTKVPDQRVSIGMTWVCVK